MGFKAFWKYKDRAIILEKRAGGTNLRMQKMKTVRKGGGDYELHLMSGDSLSHVSNKDLFNIEIVGPPIIGKKTLGTCVILTSPEKGVYNPVNPNVELGDLKVVPQEWRAHYTRETESAYQDYIIKKDGWLNQNRAIVIIAITGLVVLGILYLAFSQLLPAFTQISASNVQIAEALDNIAPLTKQVAPTVLS